MVRDVVAQHYDKMDEGILVALAGYAQAAWSQGHTEIAGMQMGQIMTVPQMPPATCPVWGPNWGVLHRNAGDAQERGVGQVCKPASRGVASPRLPHKHVHHRKVTAHSLHHGFYICNGCSSMHCCLLPAEWPKPT